MLFNMLASFHREAKLPSVLNKLLQFGVWLLIIPFGLSASIGGIPTYGAVKAPGDLSRSQVDQYKAQVPKTIIELQQFRQTSSIRFQRGGKQGTATLINLNPTINAWYLLQLEWNKSKLATVYHLENRLPQRQYFLLDEDHPYGLVLVHGERKYICDLWSPEVQPTLLEEARRSEATYAPLCGGLFYLRNPTKGYRTLKERVTEVLRDNLKEGERVIVFVKDHFFKDTYLETDLPTKSQTGPARVASQKEVSAPRPALIAAKYSNRALVPSQLGIKIEERAREGLIVGQWYSVLDNPGIYVSLVQPGVLDAEILQSYRTVVNPLDNVEVTASVYLVAFDLTQFDVGFALGTDHPRVGWSAHIPDRMKDKTLPGPDGIGSIAPLISTGLVNPYNALKTVATFTGGFKRAHGAFLYGDFALKNAGTHYGFIENGVVFSKLQPGLATLLVFADGSVDMKTWTEEDNNQLATIKHARQNGVPIIDFVADTQTSVPGALVNRWGPGNWSGSADRELRTLRAGACLQEHQGKRFLIYGYFSSATPSAMARVFQAYSCRYAMLLDMNALEHTYLAVYRRKGAEFMIQHLIQGMSELDKTKDGQYIPRFIGYADNRDFFYLMRREP